MKINMKHLPICHSLCGTLENSEKKEKGEIMDYIFCNISWMKYYNGITREDQPKHAGHLIKDPSDVFEKDNFRDFNGNCYGYVRTGGDILLDKHFRSVSQGAKELQGVTVVFTAALNEEESRIVGWYENATVYREMVSLPLYEEDYLYFNFKAKVTDCTLLPEEQRTFSIKRSKSSTPQKGASKSNLWYAKSEYGRTEFIPKVHSFIRDYEGPAVAIGILENLKEALPMEDLSLVSYEDLLKTADDLYEEEHYKEAVLYYQAALLKEATYDAGFGLANAYCQLNAFSETIRIAEDLLKTFGESRELIELLYVASDVILEKEKAPGYFRRLNELEGTPLSDREYYDYLNEVTDLFRSYGQYLR